jgi:hypothetical protein
MDEEVKWKVSWTVGLILMGWWFLLFLPPEDGVPVAQHQWILWLAINAVALVKVHGWLRGCWRD